MQSKLQRRFGRAVLVCAIMSVAPLSAHAQTWTGAGGDNNFTNNANWFSGTAPTSNTGTNPIFGNLTNANQRYTIAMPASFIAQSLVVSSTVAYTFSGTSGNILGLGSPTPGGTSLSVLGSGGATFGALPSFSSNNTVTASGGNVTFNSGASHSGTLTLNAASGRTITVNGFTSLGSANTFRATGAGNVVFNHPAYSPSSSASVVVNAGTVSFSGNGGATGVLPNPTVNGGTLRALTNNASTGLLSMSGGTFDVTGTQSFNSGSVVTGGRITGTGVVDVFNELVMDPLSGDISVEAHLDAGYVTIGATNNNSNNEIVFSAPLRGSMFQAVASGYSTRLRFTAGSLGSSVSMYSVLGTGNAPIYLDGGSPVQPGGLIYGGASNGFDINAANGPRTLNANLSLVNNSQGSVRASVTVTGSTTIAYTSRLDLYSATLGNVSVQDSARFFSYGTSTVTGAFVVDNSVAVSGSLVANPVLRTGSALDLRSGNVVGTVSLSGVVSINQSQTANYGVAGQLDINSSSFLNLAQSDPFGDAAALYLRVSNSPNGTPGRLNFNATHTLPAKLVVEATNSIIDNNGFLTVTPGVRFTSLGFINDGNLALGAGGSFPFGGAFTNNGNILFGSNTVLALGASSPFNNATATLELPVTAKITGPASSPLTNNATLVLAGGEISGGLAVTNALSGIVTGRGVVNAPFNNLGDLSPASGTLTLSQGLTNSGVVRVSPTGNLVTGSFYLSNSGLITGAGSLPAPVNNLAGGQIQAVGGALYLTQPVLSQAGSRLLVTPGGTLYMPAGFDSQTSNGLISLSGGTFNTSTARVTNSSTGVVNGYGNVITGGFRNSGSITLAGGTTLWEGPLANDPARTVRIQAGTGVFTGPVTNNGTILVASGGNAVFAGGFSGGSPTSGGPGANALLGAGTTTLSNFTYAESDGLTQAGLTLGAGATFKVVSREPTSTVLAPGRAAPASLSVVGTLSLGSGAFVDLTTNDLLLRSTSLASARSAVASWWNGGARNGTGLGSSSAFAADFTTVAVFPNDASASGAAVAGLGYYDAWGGNALASTDVLVRFAYLGDTDLDGVLTARDFANVIEGFSAGLTGWQHGDLDYDNAVTGADLSLFLNAYAARASLPPLGGVVGTTGGTGAVPEPGAIALVAAALPLASRRRRR